MHRLNGIIARILPVLLGMTPMVAVAVNGKDAGSETAEAFPARADEIIGRLATSGDLGPLREAADRLFDQVIGQVPAADDESFITVALARRLIRILAPVAAPVRKDLASYLVANRRLARTLAFLIWFAHENPVEITTVLNVLRELVGPELDDRASLVAAICVVHDRPLQRRINENTARAPEPAKIFDYYRRNERSMLFGIRDVPAEVLVYVVDTTASIDEMQWALEEYAGDTNVGSRFFDVKYDTAHFRSGSSKQVTRLGFNLPNIRAYGGVCADQAYFATSVGKAIGVPTAYTVGQSGQMRHAWIGYLQARGKRAWWNFDEGRYGAYRAVRGVVLDPQIRQPVPDAQVSLMAELIGSRRADRHAAAALTDAALWLMVKETEDAVDQGKDAAGDGSIMDARARVGERKAPAAVTVSSQGLLERGLRRFPGYARGWFALCDLAVDGKLSLTDKQRWAKVLQKLCGQKYPDFVLAVLVPMVATVKDSKEQNRLWNGAFDIFSRRPDLAAEVRIRQGRMWERSGEHEKAGRCYEDVLRRYANAGPFVLEALSKSEQMLRDLNQPKKVPALYQQAWRRITKPTDARMEFRMQSNWYRIGMLLVKKLEEGGRDLQANQVRSEIERTMSIRGVDSP